MTRHGLRVIGGDGYEWPAHLGDVLPYGNSSREQVETIRQQMGDRARFHEVVQLDEDWQVIEPRPPMTDAASVGGGIPGSWSIDAPLPRVVIEP